MQKRGIINGAYLTILLCLLLDAKSIINYSDSISIALTGILFLICFISAFRILTNRKSKSKFIIAFTFLMLLFTIYGSICILKGDDYVVGFKVYSSRMYLMDIYLSLLPIYAFYYHASQGSLTKRSLKLFWWSSLLLAILLFFRHESNMLQEASPEAQGVVNNFAYTILPFLLGVSLYYNRRTIQYLIFGIVAIFLLLGLKRGAMAIYPFCLLYFLQVTLKNTPSKYRIMAIFISIVFIAALIWYLQYRYSTDLFFQSRIEQTEKGESSGRDILYSVFWKHFIHNPSFLKQLFGEGAMATIKVSFNFAHCDWLEILINQGILGVLVYLYYWITLIGEWLKSKKISPEASLAIGLFVIIYLSRSIFSMGYTGCTFCAASIFGYYLFIARENSF